MKLSHYSSKYWIILIISFVASSMVFIFWDEIKAILDALMA
jgi:hypothetical protein